MESVQEIDAGEHVGSVFPIDAQRDPLLSAQGDVDGIKRLLQLRNAHVFADFDAALEFDAQVEDLLDLSVQYRLGQSVTGDTPPQHPARLLHGLEDCHAIASASQLVGAGETAGPAAHDGDLLRLFLFRKDLQREPLLDAHVAHRAFDLVDTDGAFEFLSVAFGLAGSGTDAAAGGWKGAGVRVGVPGLLECLLHRFAQPFGLGDGGDEFADAVTAGAGISARWFLLRLLRPQRRLLARTGTRRKRASG